MMARVSKRRLALFFSTQALWVLLLSGIAIYLRQPLVGLGGLFLAAFYGYLVYRRLLTTGLNGTFEIGADGLVFRTNPRAVHSLAWESVKAVQVRTLRRQRLLFIEGYDEAALYLPDIYDVPVDTLAEVINLQLNERRTV